MAYFTVSEFRARYSDLTVADGYPDTTVEEYRVIAEEAFEDAAGVAFEPRTTTRTLYLDDFNDRLFLHPRLRTVTAVLIDGTALTDLTGLRISESTLAGYRWRGQIVVTYTHGFDAPPARVKQAVMILAKTWMVQGPIDDRATQLGTEDGPINLATPGILGSTFGIPEVDQTLRQYGMGTVLA